MDFKAQLRKQIGFLRASCLSYDAGNRDEGVRIAVALRVLFHQTKRSTSLLMHLGGANIRLLSTCVELPSHASWWTGITRMVIAPAAEVAEFIPHLGASPSKNYVRFLPWWEAEVIYFSNNPRGFVLKRKDLVLAAANTDGGAHVDSAFGAEYQQVLEGAGWAITLNPDNGPSKSFNFRNAHLAALRQIGYEVLNSPELLKLQE